MKTENAILMKQAREALSGKWGLAVGTFFIYILITIILSRLHNTGSLISLIISGPLMLGMAVFSISIARKKEARLEQLFEGFKRFGKSLLVYLLIVIFTLLWTLLLIVPGIIAGISYSQIFFILADDESISAKEAMKKSKQMMYGYKWKYLCLGFRFFGWGLLSILTLGVGFIWLFPYMYVSMAKFYDDISGKSVSQNPAQ
jgi:uncharacterized membrane protein